MLLIRCEIMLRDFFDLPEGARKLIMYYAISMFDSVGFFVVFYMFALGFTVITIGALYSYLLILTAVLEFVLGRLIDIKLPPKYLMIIVEVLGSIYWLMLYYARTLLDFVILYSFGAIIGIFMVAYRPIERDLYPQDRLDVAYKHHMFWPYFAQFVLVLIYGYILQYDFLGVFKALMVFAAAMCVLRALYIMLYIPKTKPIIRKNEEQAMGKQSLPRSLLWIMSAEILMVVAFDIAPTFILANYLFNIMKVDIFRISLIYSLGGLMGALSAMMYDKARRISGYNMIYISILALGIFPLIIYCSQYSEYSFLIVLLAMLITYFFWPIWWIIHEVIIMRSVPSNLRGTIFGALSATKTILVIPLPILAALLTSINPLTPFLAQAILFLILMPLYYQALKGLQ